MLEAGELAVWLQAFLPRLAQREACALFEPAVVRDRSDGKIAHLDGLNLSRAWCWRSLATSLSVEDPRREVALAAAEAHLASGLPYPETDYMGAHWHSTCALLALDTAPPT